MADPPAILVVIHLTPDLRAAAVARQLVTATCESSGFNPDTSATAALLVSELVTNAVLHAGTEIRLEIRPAASTVRVNVSDQDAQTPVQAQPRNPTALHGRGLRLVETLARAWGVDRTDAGKTVWFELDMTQPPPGQPDADDRDAAKVWHWPTSRAEVEGHRSEK